MAWWRHNIVITTQDPDEREPVREAYNSQSATRSGMFLGAFRDPEEWATLLVAEFNKATSCGRELLDVEILRGRVGPEGVDPDEELIL